MYTIDDYDYSTIYTMSCIIQLLLATPTTPDVIHL